MCRAGTVLGVGKQRSFLIRSGPFPYSFRFFTELAFCSFCVCVGNLSAETAAAPPSKKEIPSPFFLEPSNASVSFGISGSASRRISPNVGIWGRFPIPIGKEKNFRTRNRWNAFGFLQKETRRFEDRNENDSIFRSYAGIRSSWFSENGFRSSLQLGWERGESDLLVLGIRFEIPNRQGFQILYKSGSEFRSVSLLFYSPLRSGTYLIFGISRIHTKDRPEGREDSYSFGIGWSWDKAEFSVFGTDGEISDSSIGGTLGWNFGESEPSVFDENVSDASSENSETARERFRPDRKSISPIARYTIRKLGLQELLSFGLSLDSSLRISRESAGSAEEFGTFLESLSDREKTKVFALLRRKNPRPQRKGNRP